MLLEEVLITGVERFGSRISRSIAKNAKSFRAFRVISRFSCPFRVFRVPNFPSFRKRLSYDVSPLSYAVIGAYQDVQRQLGVHCMEVDYQRALEIALNKRGLTWQREVEIPIAYDGIVVTKRRVDFLIQDRKDQLILETKAASEIKPEDVEQCLLYLHQGNFRLCLMINFGVKPLQVRRFVHTPET